METNAKTRTFRLIRLVIITALALCVPLVAMQLSSTVNWTLSDFVVAGALFISFGILHEFGVMSLSSPARRIAGTLATIGLFLLIWVQLSASFFN